ncbi:MAG: TIR domain-containing protein [Candidatus Binatia bacterium]
MTPDEHAELREELRPEPKDDPRHVQAGYQPRPNVLLETGIALGALRDKTLIVVKGQLREVTNLGGVHVVHWEDSTTKRIELVERLRGLDIPVVTSGTDWQHG